jgi:hypothetical protein
MSTPRHRRPHGTRADADLLTLPVAPVGPPRTRLCASVGDVASVDQCRDAVVELNSRLAGLDQETREAHVVDRTLELELIDLDTALRGHLRDGQIVDITEGVPASPPKANIRLIMSSDDLLALIDGSLAFPGAWASGRIRLDASLSDLWRLRKML